MSGHSKWSTIKRKKVVLDQKRGKLFSSIGREITISARLFGGDIEVNARLRQAVKKAKSINMPSENIDKAIKKGTGNLDNVTYEEASYEGYGPNGIAVFIETITDNKNRTVAEVRHGFSKFGGSLGTNGSVAYLFEKTGVISFSPGCNEEQIMEIGLESGAHDVVSNGDGSIDVMTTLETFGAVQDGLKADGLAPENAEVTMLASTEIDLDLDGAQSLLVLIEHMEDLDDVQNVYSNANFSDEIASQL